MSALHHVSTYQMRMFVPAGELADPHRTNHGDLWLDHDAPVEHTPDSLDDVRAMRQHKLERAYTGGAAWSGDTPRHGEQTLFASIHAEGVKEPVSMRVPLYSATRPRLINGHHRVFTSDAIDPKREIPVEWK